MGIRKEMDYQVISARNTKTGELFVAVTRTDSQYRTLVMFLEDAKLDGLVTVKELEAWCEQGLITVDSWELSWIIQESEGLAYTGNAELE